MALQHAWAIPFASSVISSFTWSDSSDTNNAFLEDGLMDKLWEAETSPSGGISVVIALSGASEVNCIAVLNSNVAGMSGTPTLKVEGADDSAFTTNAVTVKAASTLNITGAQLHRKDHVLQFTATTKQYWRLTWTWTGTAQLKVGEIVLGKSTALSRAIVYGNTEGAIIKKTSVESATGGIRSHFLAGPIKTRTLPFEDLDEDEQEELLTMYLDSNGGATSMLWIEEYEATSTAADADHQRCIFGKLEEDRFTWDNFDFGRSTPSALTIRSHGREAGG